jgi:proteasome lid subunit RPN8/RPN11
MAANRRRTSPEETSPWVRISERAAAAIKDLATIATPFETGGIVAGVATDGGVWITTVVEIPVPQRRRSKYEVPAGVTPMVIRELRKRDSRLGYIGDWHSHPADASVSDVDLRTLSVLTSSRANARRLILIARAKGLTWTIEAWGRRGRHCVPVKFELTGDLQPPT